MSDGARCHYCRKVPCECYDLSQPSPLKFVPSVASDSTLPTVPERDELRSQNAALQSQLTGALNQLQGTECEAAALRERIAELEAQITNWHAKDMCDVCGGNGTPVSGKTCICGGSGSVRDAFQNIRRDFIDVQLSRDRALSELAEARKALELVISECYTNLDCNHQEQDSHICPEECEDIDDCIGCTIVQLCQNALAARAAIPATPPALASSGEVPTDSVASASPQNDPLRETRTRRFQEQANEHNY